MASMDVIDFKNCMERGALSVQQLFQDQASAPVQVLSILDIIDFLW